MQNGIILNASPDCLTPNEAQYRDAIRSKESDCRRLLASSSLAEPFDPAQWLNHLTELKHALGNLSNGLGFLATMLVKKYLEERFQIVGFDAAGKAQGASGPDIEARTRDGKFIEGELKTTKPYQPGFGAAQRNAMLKDLARLSVSRADFRFMFVTDAESYRTLCYHPSFSSRAPGIEIVDLVTGNFHRCV